VVEGDRVRVYNATGAQIWSSDDLGDGTSTVSVGDIDNDGRRDDFVVATHIGVTRILVAFNTSDGLTWQNPWNASRNFTNEVNEIAFGDFDGDGYKDDVAAVGSDAWNANATAFAGNNGSVIFHITDNLVMYSLTAVDLDHDGRDELAIGRRGDVTTYRWNGTWGQTMTSWSDYLWRATQPNYETYELSVADLDGDGYQDDIAVGDTDYIMAFHNDSSMLWNYSGVWGTINSMSIGDIDDDGKLDIFGGGSAETVWALNMTGGLLWAHNISHGQIASRGGSSPATDISDINNDGIADAAAASYDGYLHLFESGACDAIFSDGSYNMTWNDTVHKWEVNRTFSAGIHSYNITCSKGGYTAQTSSSSITVVSNDYPNVSEMNITPYTATR
jgi:hypothetical protein